MKTSVLLSAVAWLKAAGRVAVAAAALGACMPVSHHPLSDPSKSKADPLIIGQWHYQNEGKDILIRIGASPSAKCPGCMRAVSEEKGEGGKTETLCADFFPTPIGGKRFFNVPLSGEKMDFKSCGQEKPWAGYLFFQYEITGGKRLTLNPINYPELMTGVRKGELEGEWKQHSGGSKTLQVLTSPGEKLRKYIQKNSAKFVIPAEEEQYLEKME